MKTIFLILSLFLVLNCQAQIKTDNPLMDKLDSVINASALKYMSDTSRVSLSIGIVNHGQYSDYNYGQTTPISGQLPTLNSIYEIGSITKTFTALMIAHAVADKKLSLNDDIRKYLKGNYPNLQYANGEPVKVIYLLTHVSRFPRSFNKPVDANFTMSDFEQELHQVKLDTLTPYRYQYSNAGYQILGNILENIYKKPYAYLLKKLITDPLYMPATKINFDKADAPYLLSGYDVQKKIMPDIASNFPGAGSIRTNMVDMLTYMDYQLKDSDAVVQMTHKPVFGSLNGDENALPWAVGRTRDWDYYIREDGGTRGYRCFMVMYPDYQAGIMLMTNQTDNDAGRKLYELSNAIFNALKKEKAPNIAKSIN